MLIWQFATLTAYFVKGVCGFASTLVFSSIVSFAGTANIAITPVDLLLGSPANAMMAWRYRRHASAKIILPMVGILLVSSAVGIFLLRNLDTTLIKLLFGLTLIVMGAQSILSDRIFRKEMVSSPVFMTVISILSGLLTGLFGVGALLAATFSRACPDSKTFKGNMCLVFLVEDIFRIIVYFATGILHRELVLRALALAPAMIIGMLAGMKCAGRINEKTTRLIVNIFLILSGAVLLWGQISAML